VSVFPVAAITMSMSPLCSAFMSPLFVSAQRISHSAASGFMLAAAERHGSCRNAAEAAKKRTATDVTPQWNGSAEAARPPGRHQAACQLQCVVGWRFCTLVV
jgi:hypothetical protein